MKVSRCLVAAVCFAFLVSGCSGRSQVPTGSSSPTPTAPSGAVLTGSYTISGVVVDESGRPVGAANVDPICEDSPTGYFTSGIFLLTDDNGQYRTVKIPACARLWLVISKDAYVQQCAALVAPLNTDVQVDPTLVSRSNLTAVAQSATGLRSVSGTVVENTSTGKQPVAGVMVFFETLEDLDPAETYADQSGRFALCGLPAGETVQLRAYVPGPGGGREARVDVPPGQTVVEIVLP